MSETLLSGSAVLLYGRILADITIDQTAYGNTTVPRRGVNRFLENNLSEKDARLARIYGYAYEGQYYELATPAIFVVHGDGEDPQHPRPMQGTTPLDPGPGNLAAVGMAYQFGNFAGDIKVWAYDKADFSVRLDVASGMLEDILLQAELFHDDPTMQFGGGKVGGGKVGGGKVGGGKVGG